MNRTVLSVTVILFALAGCGPAPGYSSNITRNSDRLQLVQESGKAEISAAKISNDIVGRVVQVAELKGARDETEWTFAADEFRQVDILERHMTEKGLTLVIFMMTRNNPRPDEDPVQVAGKLQLQYARRAGRWILTSVENRTFSYSVGQSI